MRILKPKRKLPKREGRSRKGEGSVFLRGTVYWYKIPVPGGKPLSGSCETSDYAEALTCKHQRLMESHRKRKSRATVAEILADYAAYIEKEKPKSRRSIFTAIKHLKQALGTKIADDLTTEDTEEFRRQRESTGCVFSTVNRELGYLRGALSRELRATPSRITQIPYMRRPSEKNQVREGFIDRDGYQKILAELPQSLKALFVCAFHTGARLGELLSVKWEHIDFENGIIELTSKTTKNSEGRWIPIWGDMGYVLRSQRMVRDNECPRCNWVFFWHRDYHARATPGTRITDFRWAWHEACERAGFPGLIFHDLRRSGIRYASREAGLSDSQVMLMSGHKTPAMLRRYNIRDSRDAMKIGRALDATLKGQK